MLCSSLLPSRLSAHLAAIKPHVVSRWKNSKQISSAMDSVSLKHPLIPTAVLFAKTFVLLGFVRPVTCLSRHGIGTVWQVSAPFLPFLILSHAIIWSWSQVAIVHELIPLARIGELMWSSQLKSLAVEPYWICPRCSNQMFRSRFQVLLDKWGNPCKPSVELWAQDLVSCRTAVSHHLHFARLLDCSHATHKGGGRPSAKSW